MFLFQHWGKKKRLRFHLCRSHSQQVAKVNCKYASIYVFLLLTWSTKHKWKAQPALKWPNTSLHLQPKLVTLDIAIERNSADAHDEAKSVVLSATFMQASDFEGSSCCKGKHKPPLLTARLTTTLTELSPKPGKTAKPCCPQQKEKLSISGCQDDGFQRKDLSAPAGAQGSN